MAWKVRKKKSMYEMIFDEETIQKTKKAIRNAEANPIDGPDSAFSKVMKYLGCYDCIALAALDRCRIEEKKEIMLLAEGTYNRFGVTLFNTGDSVKRCLTKEHYDCTGYNDNPLRSSPAQCLCCCHKGPILTLARLPYVIK